MNKRLPLERDYMAGVLSTKNIRATLMFAYEHFGKKITVIWQQYQKT